MGAEGCREGSAGGRAQQGHLSLLPRWEEGLLLRVAVLLSLDCDAGRV